MLSYRELTTRLRELGVGPHGRVIAHVYPPALGPVAGGTETVLGGLLASCEILLMPAFTFQTMVTPAAGPPENGLSYGSDPDQNLRAEFYHPNLPPDPAFGEVAQALQERPGANRSGHPVLSFVGLGADGGLNAQTLENPLAPIGCLPNKTATSCSSTNHSQFHLHYAEQLAGRKRFCAGRHPEVVAALPSRMLGWLQAINRTSPASLAPCELELRKPISSLSEISFTLPSPGSGKTPAPCSVIGSPVSAAAT
jgi:aminoglycoside N3'-acetyltransferase